MTTFNAVHGTASAQNFPGPAGFAIIQYVGTDGNASGYDGSYLVTVGVSSVTVQHRWYNSADGTYALGGNAGLTYAGLLPTLVGGRGSDKMTISANTPYGFVMYGDTQGDIFNTEYGKADKLFGSGGPDKLFGQGGADYLSGASGADQLYGGTGADILLGGEGTDFMRGDGGNDSFYVDNANDVVADGMGGGVDTVFSSISLYFSDASRQVAIGGFQFNRTFAGIENLTLTGTATYGTGQQLANTIVGNGSVNVLRGAGGNDTLSGQAGSDQLYGDANNDTLVGGLGNDQMWGGANNDFFVFTTAPHSTGNRDLIWDFYALQDTIRLDNAVFKKLGGVGVMNGDFFKLSTQVKDANDYIQYNKASGGLFYDVDGSGRSAPIQFAILMNKAAVGSVDFHVI